MATSTHPDQRQDSKLHQPPPSDLSLMQVMGSVLAAGFGVQSKENKVRDFTRGKPVHFIIAGLTFTVALLVGLILVVTIVA
jgi:hypothetical protein